MASMLNYFLLQLVGPQRKSLSLKDPEKYEFRPKQLLKQVCIRALVACHFQFMNAIHKLRQKTIVSMSVLGNLYLSYMGFLWVTLSTYIR